LSDLKLFRTVDGSAEELHGTSVALERSLQTLIERNLEAFLGVRFLASEHSTGQRHRGRIDTLGIDENGSPVIIEYKRSTNENVINQGLFYLDWLMDHKAEFKLLVLEKLGNDQANAIEWSAPRLLCIAGDFTRYDEHAVQQMDRNIELIRYRRFGDDLLLFELVNATTATTPEPTAPETSPANNKQTGYKTIDQTLERLSGPLLDLYEELEAYLIALGDDVQIKTLKYYVAFKRLRNFACVEVHPRKGPSGALSIYVKVNPDSVDLSQDFLRDVRSVGHFGTGELEITIQSREDLERAKPLMVQSYEAS
jgi:predicted transport protein